MLDQWWHCCNLSFVQRRCRRCRRFGWVHCQHVRVNWYLIDLMSLPDLYNASDHIVRQFLVYLEWSDGPRIVIKKVNEKTKARSVPLYAPLARMLWYWSQRTPLKSNGRQWPAENQPVEEGLLFPGWSKDGNRVHWDKINAGSGRQHNGIHFSILSFKEGHQLWPGALGTCLCMMIRNVRWLAPMVHVCWWSDHPTQ